MIYSIFKGLVKTPLMRQAVAVDEILTFGDCSGLSSSLRDPEL